MFDVLLNILILVMGVPVCVFTLECALGLLYKTAKQDDTLKSLASACILIPAHNEEKVIGTTLNSIQAQLDEGDKVILVADNCSDATAKIAQEYGVTVLERHNLEQRGKGYALDHGIKHIATLPESPDMVIVIDADCLLGESALQKLKVKTMETARPVQACYLMQRGDIERITVKVSEFAFMIKNKVRMRGASILNIPVPLTGTGMSFPWSVISQAQLATGDIVEDMRLGVELVVQKQGAVYCDEAFVYSHFPVSEEAEKSQRERWEHGHLSTLSHFLPKLLLAAFGKMNVQALGMLCDLCIPPFTLLLMLVVGVFASICTLEYFNLVNVWLALITSYLVSLSFIVMLVWFKQGRDILSLGELLKVPLYVISKLYIYVGYIVQKQTKWIRTDRD